MKRSSRSKTSPPKPTRVESKPTKSSCESSSHELPPEWHLERIISGGQTGVDRAALDAAIELGIPHGGWCPRGRRSENGVIPRRYQLKEIEGIDYSERTQKNIVESDATLILTTGALQGGTLLTFNLCKKLRRPVRVIQLSPQPSAETPPLLTGPTPAGPTPAGPAPAGPARFSMAFDGTAVPKTRDDQATSGAIRVWLAQSGVRILNVAGPRASKSPEIYQLSKAFLVAILNNGGASRGS